MPLRERLTMPTILVGAAIVTGIAIRIWVLASPLGTLESDEAIVGLMARRALHGEFNVLYWLSYYGGTQEALLTAVVFAVVGSSVLALKLTAMAVFAVDAVLIWRVGIRTVAELAAGSGLRTSCGGRRRRARTTRRGCSASSS